MAFPIDIWSNRINGRRMWVTWTSPITPERDNGKTIIVDSLGS